MTTPNFIMIGRLLRLTALSLVLLLSIPGGASAEPFELRGFRLGMLLSEFRSHPFPDGGSPSVICSGDREVEGLYELYVHGDNEVAGVIKCNFFKFRKTDPGSLLPPKWREETMKVATVRVFMAYDFVPDPQRNNEPALYQITVRSNSQYWDKFWEGYNGKFGKPVSVSNDPIQNPAGAIFDNTTAIWANHESTITMFKRLQRVDTTYIFYGHTRLAKQIKKNVRATKGHPGENL